VGENVRLRVVSLNLRAYPNPNSGQIGRLAAIIAECEPDVVLLQECRQGWLEVVCDAAALKGKHAHRVAPDTPLSNYSPDGTAIAVRDPISIERVWRIAPEEFRPETVQQHLYEVLPQDFKPMPERLMYRYSGRTLLAQLRADERVFVAGSFHATPGTGRIGGVEVREWKPFFHGAVAIHLARLELSFVFAIDANEPRTESLDSVGFHWAEGRSGVAKLQALLGLDPLHAGRDLFREWFRIHDDEPVSKDLLAATYAPSEEFQRRFDSMWATPDFELDGFATHLHRVKAVGGDDAMLVADLQQTSTVSLLTVSRHTEP
jgi:hypothetical protein